MKRYAGGFIYNPATGKLLLQQRTLDAPVNPGIWTIFGGGEEAQDGGDIRKTFVREIEEETGVSVDLAEVRELASYPVRVHDEPVERNVFWVALEVSDDAIQLGEGADYGWFSFEEARQLPVGPMTLEDVGKLERVLNG